MIFFLAQGDSAAIDTAGTFKIPEIIEPIGDMHPVGEIAVGSYEQTTLAMLTALPLAPLAYGYGDWSTVMNKGRKPAYTRLYINGRQLNTNPFGHFNLGLLPLHCFDGVLFGQAVSGAEFSGINLKSKINRYERPYSFVQFMLGSFDSNTYGFDLTRGITDDLGLYFSGAYHKTAGHRENADAQTVSVYSNVYSDYFIPLRFDALYVSCDYGFPGSIAAPLEGREKDEFLSINGSAKIGKEIATLSYDRQTVAYLDTVLERSLNAQIDHFGMKSVGRDSLFGVRTEVGTSYFFTFIDGEFYWPGISNDLNVWVMLDKSLGRFFARAGARYERMNRVNFCDVFLLPRIELEAKVAGAATAYAALSRDARSPSDIEVSAPFDSLNPFLIVAGYDSLRPEYCWCGEIGLRSDRYVLNAYRMTFNDRITVLTEFPGFYRYGNLDTWEIQGIEVYLNQPLRTYSSDSSKMTEFVVGIAGNLTLSQDPASSFPRRITSAFAAFRRDTPRFGFGLQLRAEHSSETYDILGAEYSGYTVFSVAGLVKYMGLSCVLRVNNILDEEYAYVPDFPMPPRNFDVSIKWEFWD